MRAGFFRKLWIMGVSLYATLKISLAVLYRTYLRGGYPRSYADGLFRWWALKLLQTVRLNYTVHNPHGVCLQPNTPYIVMSNHRSHYDIPLIVMAIPGSVRMLTKKELFKVPIWGPALRVAEFVSIDRRNLEQAKKDLERARESMESGIVLWIAPEGTRSRTGTLGAFKKGGFIMAIEAGATIIPVGIRGSEKILPPKTWDFHIGQSVSVHIGAPIEASMHDLERKDELMAHVRRSISELSGEPEGLLQGKKG